MKKALIWFAVILVVVWVINQPADAAGLIDKVFTAVTTLGTSL